MTDQFPTGARLVQEAVRLARAVAAGEPGHAQDLVDLGVALAHKCSHTYQRSQDHRARTGSAASDLMRAVGNAAVVRTAGEVRAALAGRPEMEPHLYLRSLGLATLPVWPLPGDDAAEVVVYRGGGTGFGRLWNAVGAGDEAETDRLVERLTETAVHGPSGFWARGLGD
ncbi:hypothetical protein [Streptomyces olivaceoviridis]|uniref:hypothetical protein n=1 Tax=Streptomyces olivaceoviridis TaxID=1921 RepID=UPI003702A7E7